MHNIVDVLTRWSPPNAPPFQPAKRWHIEDLEEMVGRPLPGAYKAFLRVMGEGTGALRIGQAEVRLNAIRERYALSGPAPAGLISIGLDQAPLATASYYLDLERPVGDDDTAVVRCAFPEEQAWRDKGFVAFASFREMLLYWAFHSIRNPQLAHHAMLVRPFGIDADPALADTVAGALDELPMQLLPHMNVTRVYDSSDAAALLLRDPEDHQFRHLRLATDDADEHRRRVALFEDLGLVLEPRPASPC